MLCKNDTVRCIRWGITNSGEPMKGCAENFPIWGGINASHPLQPLGFDLLAPTIAEQKKVGFRIGEVTEIKSDEIKVIWEGDEDTEFWYNQDCLEKISERTVYQSLITIISLIKTYDIDDKRMNDLELEKQNCILKEIFGYFAHLSIAESKYLYKSGVENILSNGFFSIRNIQGECEYVHFRNHERNKTLKEILFRLVDNLSNDIKNETIIYKNIFLKKV